jgi:hypothetical protein
VNFEKAVQEVFAVLVLSGIRYSDVINDNPALLADTSVMPDQFLGQLPESLLRSATACHQRIVIVAPSARVSNSFL